MSSRAAARRSVLLNGRVVDLAHARISALDRGFLYGDGLFETVRAYRGEPFALGAHLRRLARSARLFRIAFDATPGVWRPRVRRLLRVNGLDGTDAALRLTVSRGVGPIGLVPPARLRTTTLLVTTALDPGLAAAQARGVSVTFFPFRLVTSTLSTHKTLHYLPAVLGKMLAARQRASEAIYLATDDTVLEGTTSNVFIVRDGVVRTPPLRGILPGVTRSLLATIAQGAGIGFREEPVTRAALLSADEVFLTASTIEVLPVVRVAGHRIADGTPGPLTQALQSRYRAHVAARLRRRTIR